MNRLKLLGSAQLTDPVGTPLDPVLSQPKRLALLAYLAVANPGRFTRRDTLLALFWPEADEERGRNALSQALHFLRRSLGEDSIRTRGFTEVMVDPEHLWCDVVAFREAAAHGRLAEASGFYGGDLLEGFHGADGPGFEQWLDDQRQDLRRQFAEVAWELAAEAEARGDLDAMLGWARAASDRLPRDERALRRLMAALDRSGDRVGAIEAFEAFRRWLEEELEAEPSPETRALVSEIRARQRPETAASPVGHRPVPRSATTASARRGAGPRHPRLRVVLPAALVLFVAFAGGLAWRSLSGSPSIEPEQIRLAVLPLDNLSADEQDRFFAVGLHDELLSQLYTIDELRVSSLTAVQRYSEPEADLSGIATELDVDHLLTGSIHPSGDRVRISLHLYDVEHDRQVWAETFERSRSDLLGLRADVGSRVTAALSLRLSPTERVRVDHRPTESQEAYRSFVRARAHYAEGQRISGHRGPWLLAIEQLEAAVETDPGFVLAWAQLGYLNLLTWYMGTDAAMSRARQGEAAIRRALALAPHDPHARLAAGFRAYWLDKSFEEAYETATEVESSLPGDPDVLVLRFSAARRMGSLHEALDFLNRLQAIDPLSRQWRLARASTLMRLRRYDDATATLDDMEALGLDTWPTRYALAAHWKVDLDGASGVLDEVPVRDDGFDPALPTRIELAVSRRDYDAAMELLDRMPVDVWVNQLTLHSVDHWRMRVAWEMGAHSEARALGERSTELFRQGVEEIPDWAPRRLFLAESLAAAGRAEEARAEIEAALALHGARTDAWFERPNALVGAARVHAMLGDTTRATELLEVTFQDEYPFLTAERLHIEPWWDSLRRHSRFQELLVRADSIERSWAE
jgi:DNA-binding SARP family transcriptional activator/TolB-like protein